MLDRQTQHFLKIAELGSLVLAARELGVGQPALTRSLQSLELRLGATLLERLPRGVALTAIGRAFRDRVLVAQLTLDDAAAEIASMAKGTTGTVRIGVGLTVVEMVSDALFPRLLQDRPAAQVLFHSGLNVQLFTMVENGQLDFAVCGVLAGIPETLHATKLFSDHMQVVVRTGHPLMALRTVRLADVAKYHYVAISGSSSNQAMLEKRLSDLGVKAIRSCVETNSIETVFQIVAKTDMYAVVPWNHMMHQRWGHCLSAIDLTQVGIERSVGIVTRDGGYISPLSEYVMQLISRSLTIQPSQDAVPSSN
jgi:DNA-binding transcriptional LysR family regulator